MGIYRTKAEIETELAEVRESISAAHKSLTLSVGDKSVTRSRIVELQRLERSLQREWREIDAAGQGANNPGVSHAKWT